MTTPAIVPWRTNTTPVKDGELVNAEVTNRQPGELKQRTEYLKQRLDQIAAGAALFGRNVAVAANVLEGHAVYWNVTKQEYQLALAQVEFNSMLGGYVVSESTYAVGICCFKYGNTRADIALFGLVSDFDITHGAGVNGYHSADSGAYYLSPSTPGHFTKQKPPVSVFICYVRGDGAVHINPTPRDLLESHIHYAFDLTAEPAGHLDVPDEDGRYSFLHIDTLKQGWLPVSAFDPSIIPAGAVYGYNLAMHPELDRVWPPIPSDSVYLEIDGVGVPNSRFSSDINGLWWYDDCFGKAPWPIDPTPVGAGASSESYSSSDAGIDTGSVCAPQSTLEQQGFVRHNPIHVVMRMYFTKMVFKTANAVVTSLRPAVGSPIVVSNCSGDPATTGDLRLSLSLGNNITENDDDGLALKDVTNVQFKRGRVITALLAGSNVQLTGGVVAGNGSRSGIVTVSAVPNVSLVGDADLVALNGAQEQNYNNIFYLALPAGRNSSMRLRVSLPLAGVPSPTAKLRMRFWFMAKAAGVLPVILNSYRIVHRSLSAPAALPTTDTSLTQFPVSSSLLAYNYIEVVSDPVDVVNGDVVFFTLSRLGETDAYNSDVGVLRIAYELATS